jgi:hypothetical protein
MKHLLYQLIDCDILQNPLLRFCLRAKKWPRNLDAPNAARITAYWSAKRIWSDLDTPIWGLLFGGLLKMLLL